jgi:isopenicillin-N epimerase
MITAPLPACDPAALKDQLYENYRIEVPIVTWNERHYVRVSFQGYNTAQDADRLIEALVEALR